MDSEPVVERQTEVGERRRSVALWLFGAVAAVEFGAAAVNGHLACQSSQRVSHADELHLSPGEVNEAQDMVAKRLVVAGMGFFSGAAVVVGTAVSTPGARKRMRQFATTITGHRDKGEPAVADP